MGEIFHVAALRPASVRSESVSGAAHSRLALLWAEVASGAARHAGLYSAQLVWRLAITGARCVFSRFQEYLGHDVPISDTAAWRAIARVLRSPLDSVACALFPASCRICDTPLLRLGRIPVCDTCISPEAAALGSSCTVCGEDLGLESFPGQRDSQPLICRACDLVPQPFVRAVSHGPYQSNLRALIHLLKYEGIEPTARPLGKLLAQVIAQLGPHLPQGIVVIAVPLHPAKQRQRGFNQSELIAHEALAHVRRGRGEGLKLLKGVLCRGRTTDSQFGLTAHQRRRNVKGAFSVVKADAVRGKAVLLIDDIYTTGTTARECAKTLIAAGATEVFVVTLARAQRDGTARWEAGRFVTTPITFQSGGGTLTAS